MNSPRLARFSAQLGCLAFCRLMAEILVPKQLNFIRAFPVDATVSCAENAAVARVEPACGEVDVLRLDLQVPTALRHRPSLGSLEQRGAGLLESG